jgi:hypothetical protein
MTRLIHNRRIDDVARKRIEANLHLAAAYARLQCRRCHCRVPFEELLSEAHSPEWSSN